MPFCVFSKLICARATDGFYTFDVPTRNDDPTGTWNAYFKIGGATFHKSIPVETIKPNRLKIYLEVNDDILTSWKKATFQVTSDRTGGGRAENLGRNDAETWRKYVQGI